MGDIATLLIGIALGAAGKYFYAYLSQKGENLATKEDIAALTRIVEEIRSEHALLLQANSQEHAMRMAAIDKRLAAHQEAYARWHDLWVYAHDLTKIKTIVVEAQKWWENNCLYLDAESREAFRAAYSAAWSHKELVDSLRGTRDHGTIEKSWEVIRMAGPVIVRGAALPALTGGEQSKVDLKVTASGTT